MCDAQCTAGTDYNKCSATGIHVGNGETKKICAQCNADADCASMSHGMTSCHVDEHKCYKCGAQPRPLRLRTAPRGTPWALPHDA